MLRSILNYPLRLIFICWFLAFIFIAWVEVYTYRNYYRLALSGANWEKLEESKCQIKQGFVNFFFIIRAVDQRIPRGEKVQLVLPNKGVLTPFWEQKARYLLYPKNAGDNTIQENFILVYHSPQYVPPWGYEEVMRWGESYLLSKHDR